MCPHCQAAGVHIRKRGSYQSPIHGKRRVQRYRCLVCTRSFSDQTSAVTYRERRPQLNQPLLRLLCSGVSERRCAYILGLHRSTVAQKVKKLAARARQLNEIARTGERAPQVVVFDEMETFEHSKCKPLSIALAVEETSRRILSVQVSRMPAKGRLAHIARKRYGYRPDERRSALERMTGEISHAAPKLAHLKSDECPRYPPIVARQFPDAVHETFKGRRACVVGQGELKAGGFDPLFSLNHTCAMYRDNLKRLTRRSWCTTKLPERLQDLVDLYAYFHNARLKDRRRPVMLDLAPIS